MSVQLRQKIFRFGTLFGARITGAVALFLANLMIVNYLGLESLAKYAVLVSLASVLTVVISGGYTAIAMVFVAEYSKENRHDLLKGFIDTALKYGSTFFAILCFGLAVPFWFGVKLPILENLEHAAAVMSAAGASALLGLNSAVNVGMKRQIAGLLPDTFVRPLIFTVLTGALFVFENHAQTSTVMWLYALSAWMVYGLVLVHNRNLRRQYTNINQVKETKRWRVAALPWMGITLLWDFMIDLLLLATSVLAGSIEIAILHVCFRYRVLAGFGMRTIHTLMMPEITEHAVSGEMANVRRKLMQTNVASIVYAGIVMLGFTVMGNWLLGLFSIDSSFGVPVLLVVSATMLIRAVFGPAPVVLAIHNHHLTTLAVSVVAAICALFFVYFTFAEFGIMATATGYTGANLIASVWLWHAAKKKTGIDCSIFASSIKHDCETISANLTQTGINGSV